MTSSLASTSSSCPCGSEAELASCCLPLIQGKRQAATAEDLLRSRYTAFTRGDVDYIVQTHHSKTRAEIKREEIEDWSKNSEWLGLKIVQKEAGTAADQEGKIVFLAQFKADGKVNDHWEQSLFEKEDGQWRFVDAHGVKAGPIVRTEPKIGRNDPCGCGSGKKSKKCCGA
jgi:SEC-C motif domain protein